MRNTIFFLMLLSILFASCSKEKNESTANANSFEATLNGKKTTFTVESAILYQSQDLDEKKLDILAESSDKTVKLAISFAQSPHTGDAMSVKNYLIQFAMDDDPATPGVNESEMSFEGAIIYGVKVGANYVYTGNRQQGLITVTESNESAKTVSGNFSAKLLDLSNNIVLTITEGKFTQVKYTVIAG